ncbi:MAG: outer membrane protein assembly factor BamD [Acidobacteria bacterium]|nr:MAG: outer membrane protein assembly factor BamD [Acidobacteriota bacterium]
MTTAQRSHALVFALLAALGAAVPAAGQEIANPDLFGKSFEAARRGLEQFGRYDDPAALERVADVGYQLALQSGYREVPFSFYLIDMPVPNAFALPGGQIFVTRGMLDLGLTDDMLACLLGHEIAHVTKRHGLRLQRRATLLNVLSQALLLGVMIGVDNDSQPARDGTYQPGDNRKGNMLQGAMATGVVVSELLLRSYSRDFEDEADDEGQRLAAAAGYDPDGARQLWELMSQRIPQSKEYGYWRTHPFSDQRQRAAEARAKELAILEPKPDDDYRARTQKVLYDFGHDPPAKLFPKRPEAEEEGDLRQKILRFAEQSALTAWPVGALAEQIRLAELHRLRQEQVEKTNELARDYGAVIRAYLAQLERVRALTPQSPFLKTLEREIADLRAAATALYPKAQAVWREGIYETTFLETFLSNYPTAKEVPAVALALGDAYSRLGRHTDAVREYLRAVEADPQSEAAGRALRGLRALAGHLERPAALQQIAEEIDDETLRQLADRRLAELASTFDDIAAGAEYLERFPDGPYAGEVRERIDVLAQNLYGEVILYQGVGDHAKALERIQLILTHAPFSRAAEMLRDKAVVSG